MGLILILVVVGTAASYVVVFGLGEGRPGMVAFDVYGYYYPNILYALRGLAAGGEGLLWNPFQNCGQPFFGITETGLLYPLNLLFLVFDPQTALRGVLFANLVIGGLGTYALGRELRVSSVGSLAASLAFVLGGATRHMTIWMPTVQAPYVWMPVAMLFCERLVRAPGIRAAVLLGMSLAAGLLPGHPQFVLFTCELVALRLLWGVADRSERRQFVRALGGVALAIVVMLLLTAVQFLSSLQVIGESVRGAALDPREIAPSGNETLTDIAQLIATHNTLAPFNIVPGFLAVVAIVGGPRRRIALFYLLAAGLFLILSLGDSTWLGQIYYRLPISGLFRQPMRFRFVTAFCVAVLAGLAIDGLVKGSWRALAVAGMGLLGLYAWLGHMQPIDWLLGGTVLAGGLLSAVMQRARGLGAAVIVGTVALAPIVVPDWTIMRFLADDGPLRAHALPLERLRERLTPQDRVELALPAAHDPGLQHKTAMLFRLPAVTDYELQLSRRYAEYVTMLRRAEFLRNLNQVHFPGRWNALTVTWPLVDLAAVRYVVIAKSIQGNPLPPWKFPLEPLEDEDETLRVYENPHALPRAYYVPQVAVVADPEARLRRLARGKEDRRRLALVDTAPPAGFLGSPGNQAIADARFLVDDAEHVVVETDAPERGFVFLADQYFPAWSATVNGQPARILIGNHAFRLVEVPRGPVTVAFRYRADRVWIGALVSGVTLLAAAAVLLYRRRQPD